MQLKQARKESFGLLALPGTYYPISFFYKISVHGLYSTVSSYAKAFLTPGILSKPQANAVRAERRFTFLISIGNSGAPHSEPPFLETVVALPF
jgi:hypothetical protein